MASTQQKVWSWRHEDESGNYLISTGLDLLDRQYINKMFDDYDVYWAGALSPEEMETMLSQSINFGLYEARPKSKERSADSPSSPRTPSPTLEDTTDEELQQIGLARFVSDRVTFVYITDVFINKEFRGRGLGKWMMRCFEDVMREMPKLRRAMLLTSEDRTKIFYEEGLGMWDTRSEGEKFHVMARRAYES